VTTDSIVVPHLSAGKQKERTPQPGACGVFVILALMFLVKSGKKRTLREHRSPPQANCEMPNHAMLKKSFKRFPELL